MALSLLAVGGVTEETRGVQGRKKKKVFARANGREDAAKKTQVAQVLLSIDGVRLFVGRYFTRKSSE